MNSKTTLERPTSSRTSLDNRPVLMRRILQRPVNLKTMPVHMLVQKMTLERPVSLKKTTPVHIPVLKMTPERPKMARPKKWKMRVLAYAETKTDPTGMMNAGGGRDARSLLMGTRPLRI